MALMAPFGLRGPLSVCVHHNAIGWGSCLGYMSRCDWPAVLWLARPVCCGAGVSINRGELAPPSSSYTLPKKPSFAQHFVFRSKDCVSSGGHALFYLELVDGEA